jgi:hypothetical protein
LATKISVAGVDPHSYPADTTGRPGFKGTLANEPFLRATNPPSIIKWTQSIYFSGGGRMTNFKNLSAYASVSKKTANQHGERRFGITRRMSGPHAHQRIPFWTLISAFWGEGGFFFAPSARPQDGDSIKEKFARAPIEPLTFLGSKDESA